MRAAWRLLPGGGAGLKPGKLVADSKPDGRRQRRGKGSVPWVSPDTRAAIHEHRAAGLDPGAIASRLGLQLATVLAVIGP